MVAPYARSHTRTVPHARTTHHVFNAHTLTPFVVAILCFLSSIYISFKNKTKFTACERIGIVCGRVCTRSTRACALACVLVSVAGNVHNVVANKCDVDVVLQSACGCVQRSGVLECGRNGGSDMDTYTSTHAPSRIKVVLVAACLTGVEDGLAFICRPQLCRRKRPAVRGAERGGVEWVGAGACVRGVEAGCRLAEDCNAQHDIEVGDLLNALQQKSHQSFSPPPSQTHAAGKNGDGRVPIHSSTYISLFPHLGQAWR